jgi:hypothetical protein
MGAGRSPVPPDKAHDLRYVFDQMPGLVGQFHVDEDIAWEELAFALALLPASHLDYFLGGHQDLTK